MCSIVQQNQAGLSRNWLRGAGVHPRCRCGRFLRRKCLSARSLDGWISCRRFWRRCPGVAWQRQRSLDTPSPMQILSWHRATTTSLLTASSQLSSLLTWALAPRGETRWNQSNDSNPPNCSGRSLSAPMQDEHDANIPEAFLVGSNACNLESRIAWRVIWQLWNPAGHC